MDMPTIKTRPAVPWIPVDVEPPPTGVKVMALTRAGILIVGELQSYLFALPKPFVICWQHCPKEPDNLRELIDRMDV
jgi:hypothetical protein